MKKLLVILAVAIAIVIVLKFAGFLFAKIGCIGIFAVLAAWLVVDRIQKNRAAS